MDKNFVIMERSAPDAKRKRTTGSEIMKRNGLFVLALILAMALSMLSAGNAFALDIFAAAAKGDVPAAKLLLKKGADVNAADARGDSPLEAACENGRLAMVRFLVERGATVNAGNDDGWTPLMSAVNKGHYEIAEYLVEKGADVNCVARYKSSDDTPLLLATERNDAKTAALLLKNGANAEFVDRKGRSPLKAAKAKGNDELLALMRSARESAATKEWKATPDEAIRFAAEAAKRTAGIAGRMRFELSDDRVEGQKTYYVVHGYEVVVDDEKTGEGHTATFGWYCVDKKTGKVYEIDMATDRLVPVSN